MGKGCPTQPQLQSSSTDPSLAPGLAWPAKAVTGSCPGCPLCAFPLTPLFSSHAHLGFRTQIWPQQPLPRHVRGPGRSHSHTLASLPQPAGRVPQRGGEPAGQLPPTGPALSPMPLLACNDPRRRCYIPGRSHTADMAEACPGLCSVGCCRTPCLPAAPVPAGPPRPGVTQQSQDSTQGGPYSQHHDPRCRHKPSKAWPTDEYHGRDQAGQNGTQTVPRASCTQATPGQNTQLSSLGKSIMFSGGHQAPGWPTLVGPSSAPGDSTRLPLAQKVPEAPQCITKEVQGLRRVPVQGL